jgi:hypothetical protein
MWSRCCSSAVATVDLPEAERPVNHTVKPRWPRSWLRSCRVSDGCQVMLLRRGVRGEFFSQLACLAT